ncbi:small secreted protein [Streptomyces sp. ISL-22]|uniref:small secreted protein n=1 Tax=unclassified Streptomyces TaxID=2593676 RepID=UPI001BEB3081|nr:MULTISPECIES: small secreted protein [unclassified Streptomyces]MBT2422881.1 small secreted protein [Streptomyces sp. ISL-24]MBT2434024.1 small secreted protein [Streptomyces sp. ISL-22]
MEGTDPVNKKLAAALSGGAVLVLALTGCTSDEGNPELDAWAKKVCDAVPTQNAKISAAYVAITKAAKDTTSTPKELQQADSKAFQDLADGYKARATLISDAGAPPGVEGGARIQKDVVKKLTALSAAYADLKKQVDGLNTKDQAKFASGLKDVSAEMKQVETQRKSAVKALKKLESGDTKKALASQEGCKQAASASASAPATDS